jgi:hypothetical protein
MPSGLQLTNRISELLNLYIDDFGTLTKGDKIIYDYLCAEAGLSSDRNALNHLFTKAWAIRDGMPLALSIDNYLDAHRGDSDLELVGKMAIARAILTAESASKLAPPPTGQELYDVKNIAGTWYVRFVQLLTENVSRDEIPEALSRIAVITFNYDRTLEHFLRQALMVYYQISSAEAEGLVASLTIIHPYGVVGGLPWQDRIHGVRFGRPDSVDLRLVAGQIRTFGERIEEGEALRSIKALVEKAQTVVFLGFGFHRQNLALLTPADGAQGPRTYASTLGISPSDQAVITNELKRALRTGPNPNRSPIEPKVAFHADTCDQLLSEFRRTLTAG